LTPKGVVFSFFWLFSHLFICILFGDQIVEADALSASEGHSAVIGNANAIKAQQDVPFLEGLADWGCWPTRLIKTPFWSACHITQIKLLLLQVPMIM